MCSLQGTAADVMLVQQGMEIPHLWQSLGHMSAPEGPAVWLSQCSLHPAAWLLACGNPCGEWGLWDRTGLAGRGAGLQGSHTESETGG